MNYRRILNTLGQLAWTEAVLMLIPFVISFIYQEGTFYAFLLPIGILLLLGVAFQIPRPKKKNIYAKEGFVITGLSWIILSLFGALPFVLSGQIPSFIDAFFEIVSGFTTTGSSILNDVSVLTHSMLFWRSFSHWVGGMGVLVFIMAILPSNEGSTIFILKAESPGPQYGKLVSKLKSTARILYLIYAALTVLEMIFLLCGGMPVFDSICNAFATAGTGGFSVVPCDLATEVAFYNQYCQIVIGVFMLIFGMNFNLFYLLMLKKFKDVLCSEELRVYLCIVVVSIVSISLNLFFSSGNVAELAGYSNYGKALLDSFFQVASIQTTTGFATADFNQWPVLSKTILLILMFVGGCAGSTAGGLKVSRICILFKSMRRELKRLVHPNQVSKITFEGHVVEEDVVSGVNSYLSIFVIIFVILLFILSFDQYDFETNFSAVAACLNNIGPGFGAVGPTCSFAGYSVVSKLALVFAMLFGRLELYPMIVLFNPKTYINR